MADDLDTGAEPTLPPTDISCPPEDVDDQAAKDQAWVDQKLDYGWPEVPPFDDETHVIPPVVPDGDRSPFLVPIEAVIVKLGFNAQRREILRGLIDYRRDLVNFGLVGEQWLDGSFVENKEGKSNGEPPGDIDLITICRLPKNRMRYFEIMTHRKMFKSERRVESMFIDLNEPPEKVVKLTNYLSGLFSHQRVTFQWKGMLKVKLAREDVDYYDQLVQLIDAVGARQ